MKDRKRKNTNKFIYWAMIGSFAVVGLAVITKEKVLDKIIYR
tara:strand:+ start:200 stop:325 length:126 start_codon:yes stop_codon:yes gene_type:complete